MQISKLRWQCRRGMLELELILTRFLDLTFLSMPEPDQRLFEQLLVVDDPTLYAWIMGIEIPEDEAMSRLAQKIYQQSHL